jgi:hypothetical protein
MSQKGCFPTVQDSLCPFLQVYVCGLNLFARVKTLALRAGNLAATSEHWLPRKWVQGDNKLAKHLFTRICFRMIETFSFVIFGVCQHMPNKQLAAM